MLKRENRLKKRKSFNYIHNRGTKTHADCLFLTYVYAKGEIKIGFSVSKKTGNAVIRHRVTRQMRSAAKQLLPLIKTNHSIIFVAKETITGLHIDVIKQNMLTSLKKAGLLI